MGSDKWGISVCDASTSTIIIIGNDADFCYLMQRYVRQSGHRMIAAGLGEGALELARREQPVAVVLEVDLPGTVGWDVLRALKADEATRDIPVLVCSWLDEKECGLAEGVSGYLRKPVLYEDFLGALFEAGIDAESRPEG